jgi:hypothetical protein
MATIKSRLELLEKNSTPTIDATPFVILAGRNPSPENQTLIDAAEAAGRVVMNICFVKANDGKPEDTHCAA